MCGTVKITFPMKLVVNNYGEFIHINRKATVDTEQLQEIFALAVDALKTNIPCSQIKLEKRLKECNAI